jgi:transposase InsO family protein
MVSRNTNEGPVAGISNEDPGSLQIPSQTVELILREIAAGGELKTVAEMYGIPVGTIMAWQATSNGRVPPAGATSRTTGRYSKEFKEEVLAQVAAGRTKTDVAKQYGIHETNLYRWLRQAKENGGQVPDARSTKPPTNASPINEEHRSLVLEMKKANPKMGPAQIQNQFRRFHAIKISRQMIGRIFTEAGIPLQKPGGVKGESDPADNRFEMTRPNELWAVDFKEFWIHAEKVFGLFVLDDFSRFCVGFALTQKPTADLAIETVNAAIQRYGRPERILSDRGPQFHAWNGVSRFDKFLGDFLTDHTVTKAGHCFTNGKIEAFNRTLEEELLEIEELASLKEAEERIATFVATYNFARTHMGIGGLVPADRYLGMVAEAQQAMTEGLKKAGPGLTWLRQLVSQDGPAMRPPTLLQLVVRDGKVELVALGQRFLLG